MTCEKVDARQVSVRFAEVIELLETLNRNTTCLPDKELAEKLNAALLRYRSRTAGSDYLGGTTNIEEKKHVI
jgi:hypothetical protein